MKIVNIKDASHPNVLQINDLNHHLVDVGCYFRPNISVFNFHCATRITIYTIQKPKKNQNEYTQTQNAREPIILTPALLCFQGIVISIEFDNN